MAPPSTPCKLISPKGFPLFGEHLFDALGIDWGIGLLAFLTLAFGIPFPLVRFTKMTYKVSIQNANKFEQMYKFGPQLREIGKRRRQHSR